MDRRPLLPEPLAVLLGIALAIFLIEKIGQALLSISNVILLVALAWLLTLALRPAVNWIHHRSLPARLIQPGRRRWGDRLVLRLEHPSYGFSVFVVYIILISFIVVAVVAIIPLVIEQTRQLVDVVRQQASELPFIVQRITDFMQSAREFLVVRLNIDPALIVLPRPEEITGQIANFASSLFQTGLSVVAVIAAALGQALLVVFLSIFIMIEGRETTQYVLRLVPRQYDQDVRDILKTSERAFGGFMRGTALQALIYGLCVMIFMTLFSIGSPIAVGTITGIFMLIPVLGGIIGLALPLLAALLQSSPNTLWLMIALVITELILFNFVAPRLISRSVRIPSLLVIVALLAGLQWIGFWGFIFAVPIAAVVYSIGFVILERAIRQHERETAAPELPDG